MKLKEFFRRLGVICENNSDITDDDEHVNVFVQDKSSERHGILADIKSIRLDNSIAAPTIIIELED